MFNLVQWEESMTYWLVSTEKVTSGNGNDFSGLVGVPQYYYFY